MSKTKPRQGIPGGSEVGYFSIQARRNGFDVVGDINNKNDPTRKCNQDAALVGWSAEKPG
jgi:hypothetical protein